MSAKKVRLTVLVAVKNEELNLGPCLESVSWAEQVLVLDSRSADRTPEVAARLGAELVQFDYSGGWPKKRNWALDNVPIRNDWVLILDADERVPPELRRELERIVSSEDPHDGYWVRLRVYFLGRWIKHASLYPSWQMRLIRKDKGRYEKLSAAPGTGDVEVHELVVVPGKQGFLANDIIHEDLKPLSHFIERHNRYSTWECEAQDALDAKGTVEARLFGTAPQRRRWLKRLFVRMPLRPVIKFLWMYCIRLGMLDGRPGFIFCMMMSIHEFHIGTKRYEKRMMGEKFREAQRLCVG